MFLVLQHYAHGLAKDAVLKVASDALCKAKTSRDDMSCLCRINHTKMQWLLGGRILMDILLGWDDTVRLDCGAPSAQLADTYHIHVDTTVECFNLQTANQMICT